jgi:HEPN domain-containing protein
LAHSPEEWLVQAEADFETAQAMLNIKHYVYAVFMAHLAIEKALKGIYHKKFNELPPKTHSLSWLLEKNGLTPTTSMEEFIDRLDYASIATRYPEELMKLRAAYPRPVVEGIVSQSKEVLIWVKKMF